MPSRRILLLLSQPVIPTDNGPKHHTLGLLKVLAQHYGCDVIGFTSSRGDRQQYHELESLYPNIRILKLVSVKSGWRLSGLRLLCLARRVPVSLAKYLNKELTNYLKNCFQTNQYMAVQFDCFNVSSYRSLCEDTPTVLIPYDAFSMGALNSFRSAKSVTQKVNAALRYWQYSGYERREYCRFTYVCPVSDIDTNWLTSHDHRINARTVGIALGDEFCHKKTRASLTEPGPGPLKVVAVGFLSNKGIAAAMLEYLKSVVPLISDTDAKVQILVWGRNPPREIKEYIAYHGFTWIDYVDDYLNFLKSVDVLVYPQRCSTGIQTKVQQAIALGVPVVTRTNVLNGLGLSNEVHALGCDDNVAMARAINALILDEKLRRSMGTAGSEYIQDRYAFAEIERQLISIYQDIDGRR